MTADLASRVQRLEDRFAISDTVITYATAIDSADWALFESLFTPTVHVDFSQGGLPARDFAREEFAGFAKAGLGGFAARQHISPNHRIDFDVTDPDRAVCRSYMFAQHFLPGSKEGELFIMRGVYVNHMRRTAEGWRIEKLVQHVSWADGNTNAPTEAAARFAAAG